MKNFLLSLSLSINLICDAQFDSVSKIDESMLNTVVNIQKGQSIGTGFIVGRKNPNAYQFFLVTNKHMVGDFNFIDPFVIDSSINCTFYTTDARSNIISVKIPLRDLSGKQLATVKIHPSTTIDIAVIDITQQIRKISNWNVASVDTSFLISLKNTFEATRLGLGSQVFALGYPSGLKIESTNQPIAKAGYLASSLNGDLKIKLTVKSKNGRVSEIIPDGKYFLVDGLIVGGNSGGPIVNPQEIQLKVENGQFLYRKTQNVFIGIVSGGFGNTGITIAYSCDNIRELIDSFPIN